MSRDHWDKNAANSKYVGEGWYGTLYSYNAGVNGGYGEVDIIADLKLNGSALAWNLIHRKGTVSISSKLTSNMSHQGIVVDPYMFVMFYSIQSTGSWWNEPNRYSQSAGAR